MPHGVDLRPYIAHIYSFGLGEQWHMNLELGLTFNVVSVPNVLVSLEIFAFPLPTKMCCLAFFFYLIQQDIV